MSFKEDLQSILKDDFSEAWSSFFKPKNAGFFISALGLKQKERIFAELKGLDLDEILPNFYIAHSSQKPLLSASKAFNEGLIYLQNPSSYLSALNLQASLDDEICDMCAAPGGKSIATHALIAASNGVDKALKNTRIACIEAHKARFFTLKNNLTKYGLQNAKTYNKDARSIAYSCKERFWRIILDAPCSSYSHYNADFIEKSSKEIKALSKLQKGLLNAALSALKIGGEMIYSTCTFYRAENEEVIINALNSNFKIELLELDFLPSNARRGEYGALILPDDTYSGFFISRIKKLG